MKSTTCPGNRELARAAFPAVHPDQRWTATVILQNRVLSIAFPLHRESCERLAIFFLSPLSLPFHPALTPSALRFVLQLHMATSSLGILAISTILSRENARPWQGRKGAQGQRLEKETRGNPDLEFGEKVTQSCVEKETSPRKRLKLERKLMLSSK
ncbi:hypothetical protein BS78_03G149100 [Paspalum vaginatum]|nr:hypothetical protein BS78_03G149100 [Paspalum vaginatum]